MFCQTGNTPFEGTVQVALVMLENLNTPRSLAVHMLATSLLPHEPTVFAQEVKRLGFNPDWYLEADIEKLRFDYQSTVMLSKIPSPVENPLLREAAINSFREAEVHNASVNWLWWEHPGQVECGLRNIGCDIDKVRHIIRQILGRAPSLSKLSEEGKWTSGSSVLFSRRKSDAPNKCLNGNSVTYRLAKRLAHEGVDHPLVNFAGALSDRPTLVPGNLGDTVPKDSTTDRLIFKEPEINAFYQRCVGTKIKKRLLRWGVDLFDQTSNQRACMLAYKQRWATIDLKGASNSVCLAPVESVFPPDWFSLFEDLRSPHGTFADRDSLLDAEWHEYQMLSSMGNGFTFEVESCLFFAICVGCGCDVGETYIYGDDIIIPQDKVASVSAALYIFGFAINDLKSFTAGTFFESCGVYAFQGIDVSPFKIKDLISGNKERIVLANKLREAANSSRFYCGCDKRFLPAWKMLLSGLSKHVRVNCRGPRGSGLLLYMNRSECPNVSTARRRNRRKPDFQLMSTEHLVPVLHTKVAYHFGVSVHRHSQIGKADRAYGNIVNEFPTGGYRSTRLYLHISDWYDYGMWE